MGRSVERAFEGSPSVTVVVSDPKRAIYSFRGGDVHNYLGAVGRAEQRRTLTTNFPLRRRGGVRLSTASPRTPSSDTRDRLQQVEPAPRAVRALLPCPGCPCPGAVGRSVTDPHQRETTRRWSTSPVPAGPSPDLAGRVVELVDHGEVVGADGAHAGAAGTSPFSSGLAATAPVSERFSSASVVIGAGA